MTTPATTEPTTDPTAESGAPAQEPPKETDWQAEARKWEKRAKENKARLDEAAPKLTEYDRLRQAQQTDAERQAEELSRWQSEAEKWRGMSVTSRIEAIAAGSEFADPSDAVSALAEKAPNYLDAGGQIDEKAIRDDLKALLERKPHWRRQDGTPTTPRVPAPNRAQGAGNGSTASGPAAEFAAILRGQMNGS